ncbi:MAG: hypothetical protein IPF61_06025 [Xanthomonadales bacterium]|nr:hypothetical protein [Xanthomonadales bacterium]
MGDSSATQRWRWPDKSISAIALAFLGTVTFDAFSSRERNISGGHSGCNMVVRALFALCLCATSIDSFGQIATGNELQESLSNGSSDWIDGVVLATYSELVIWERAIIGARPQATRKQIVAVAKKYIDDHPEKWQDYGRDLIADSFRIVWPCKK